MTGLLEDLCKDWHEAGRAEHERRFENLPYEEDSPNYFISQGNYAFLLEGNGKGYAPSICFAVDLKTGNLYPVERDGLIKINESIGILGVVTGQELREKRRR